MGNSPKSDLPSYTAEQVKEHVTKDDCWIIYNKKVYDVTTLLEDHSGGMKVIFNRAGTNCTDLFDDMHGDKSREHLQEFLIGTLSKSLTV